MSHLPITAQEEHRFWLTMLHAQALDFRNHMSPAEKYWVASLDQYIFAFEELLLQLYDFDIADREPDPAATFFRAQSYKVTWGFHQLTGHLQTLRLDNAIALSLSPSYINPPLTEQREYLCRLFYEVRGLEPPELPMLDWLEGGIETAIEQTSRLAHELDPIEASWVAKVEGLRRSFQGLYIKGISLKGFTRFTAWDHPIYEAYWRDLIATVIDWRSLLEKLIVRYEKGRLANETTAL